MPDVERRSSDDKYQDVAAQSNNPGAHISRREPRGPDPECYLDGSSMT